jgi:anti-sigma-K factor RskA
MTAPGQDSVQDLAAAYALGALPPEEVTRFEAFLATSPEAQREVAELQEVAALLALGQGESAPSADLRERVLARVSGGKTVPISRTMAPAPVAHTTASASRGRVPPLYWTALAASILAAVGLGWSTTRLRNDLAALQETVTSTEAMLADRQRRLEEREATLNSIFEPSVKLYQLAASGDPEPGIQLFWDQKRNTAIIHGFRLRPVPGGREYQLWFIKDGKPVPSVTFKPESTGHARVEKIPVPVGGALSAAAITVEPEGGSQQPTSPIVLVGALQKS